MNLRFLVHLGIALSISLSGCMGFGDVDPEETIIIDYENHVAPLIEEKCGDCHGNPPIGGSVTITDQASVIEHAHRIHARAVITGDMPPGSPLTVDEKRILDTWIRAAIATPAPTMDAGIEMPSTWTNDIGPLFEQTCVACHNANAAQSGLDLSSYEGLSTGGGQGPLLDSTDPDNSLLIDYLKGRNGKLQMPPGGALTDAEINLVEMWLLNGAPEGVDP